MSKSKFLRKLSVLRALELEIEKKEDILRNLVLVS